MSENELIQSKLQGLCKTCMRRKRCPKAYRYLNLEECKAYKIHCRRGTNNDAERV